VIGDIARPGAQCYPEEPCDQPAVASMLIFSRAGHADRRVFVGARGRFQTHLAPGSYRIRAAPPPQQGRLTPSSVRVPRRGVVHLHLKFK
jgi:hypothetical protein